MSPPTPTQLRYKKGARLRHRSRQSQQKLYRNTKNSGSCLGGPELEFFAMICQGARHLLLKETVRTSIFIASVAAAVAMSAD
jgi:hypothetical protein